MKQPMECPTDSFVDDKIALLPHEAVLKCFGIKGERAVNLTIGLKCRI